MQRSRHPFRQEVFGGLAYDPRTEAYFLLNDSAFSVLALLDEGPQVEKLAENVLRAVARMQAGGELSDASGRMLRGRLVHNKPNVLAAPTIVEVYPNFTCNERCEFCYVGDEVENARADNSLPREQIPTVARKLADAGVFNATILGGEPFLYHSLDLLIEQLANRNLDTSLSTNGTVLNKTFLEAVKLYAVKLNVALHGPDAETHDRITHSKSFAKVLWFAEACSELEIGLHMTTVLHPANTSTIEEVVGLASKLGIRSMTVSYPQPTRYAKAHGATVPFSEYARVVRRAVDQGRAKGVRVQGSCHYNFVLPESESRFDFKNSLARLLYGDKAGRSRLEMTPSGDLYPTSSVFGRQEFKVGNMFTDDLLVAWANSPVLDRIRERNLPAACERCDYHAVCGGGIIGERLADNQWDVPPEDCPVLEGTDADGQPTSLNA